MGNIVNKLKNKLFLLWLLIVPPGIIFVFINFPPIEVNWYFVSVFLLFGFLTVYFPILRNGEPIFLVMWITIPAFLMYGLFVELIVMQISVLGTLFIKSNRVTVFNRLLLNSLFFFFLSIAAAFAFNFVGGEIGSIEFWPLLLAVFCYQIVHALFNDVFLLLYYYYTKSNVENSVKSFLFEYFTTLIILPLSLSFYFLFQLVGSGTFILLGLPFFFMTLIIRLHNNSKEINTQLKRASDIGHQLSELIDDGQVVDKFVESVADMFQAEYVYLYDHDDSWLELIRSYEYGKFVSMDFSLITVGQGVVGSVLESNAPIIFSSRSEWQKISMEFAPVEMESVLCVPITRNQKLESILFIASIKKSAFSDYQLKILDLLCSYFTVSVETAKYMKEAVKGNERCALTNLYNYRYLEKKLQSEMNRLKNNEIKNLSVVMLDIDHFKKVNDNYGHESGNDVLFQFAEILETVLPIDGTVGRYGGEEFLFILPNLLKSEVIMFAERLRESICTHEFSIVPDLMKCNSRININITTSVGISTAPEDTDEAMMLLRNADRALYIGAKQVGRNKVAEYVK